MSQGSKGSKGSGGCYDGLSEEELKRRVGKEWFGKYNYYVSYVDKGSSKIDFAVYTKDAKEDALVWGEAKRAVQVDPYEALAQAVLTVGKAINSKKGRTLPKPPKYLAAFDPQRMVFVPYHAVQDIFYLNDFNWNVRPSDHTTKEFGQVYDLIKKKTGDELRLFDFDRDKGILRDFIASLGSGAVVRGKEQINKTNFLSVYQRWREEEGEGGFVIFGAL